MTTELFFVGGCPSDGNAAEAVREALRWEGPDAERGGNALGGGIHQDDGQRRAGWAAVELVRQTRQGAGR